MLHAAVLFAKFYQNVDTPKDAYRNRGFWNSWESKYLVEDLILLCRKFNRVPSGISGITTVVQTPSSTHREVWLLEDFGCIGNKRHDFSIEHTSLFSFADLILKHTQYDVSIFHSTHFFENSQILTGCCLASYHKYSRLMERLWPQHLAFEENQIYFSFKLLSQERGQTNYISLFIPRHPNTSFEDVSTSITNQKHLVRRYLGCLGHVMWRHKPNKKAPHPTTSHGHAAVFSGFQVATTSSHREELSARVPWGIFRFDLYRDVFFNEHICIITMHIWIHLFVKTSCCCICVL